MTKPVTAVALLTLFEDGRFRLDDPVSRYLANWKEQEVWVSGSGPAMVTEKSRRPVTVRDMLRHTAGLTYGNALSYMGTGESPHPVDRIYREKGVTLDRNISMAEFVRRINQVPLRYHPGDAWTYSMASDVCGALVEAIADEPFDKYLSRRVLDPLGMKETGFSVRPESAARFAALYKRTPDNKAELLDDPAKSEHLLHPQFCSGGGGLVGTIDDYFRFAEMLRNDGEYAGARILAPRTVRLMLANHLPGNRDIATMSQGLLVEQGNEGVGFGLGIATTFDPIASGSIADGDAYWGGVGSQVFWIDRKAELTVIFLTQVTPPRSYDFRGQLRNIVYSSLID
jgi:CubicO group peptidase (beta-lactamase class C family)